MGSSGEPLILFGQPLDRHVLQAVNGHIGGAIEERLLDTSDEHGFVAKLINRLLGRDIASRGGFDDLHLRGRPPRGNA